MSRIEHLQNLRRWLKDDSSIERVHAVLAELIDMLLKDETQAAKILEGR